MAAGSAVILFATDDERAFARAVSRLDYGNPFVAEPVEAERFREDFYYRLCADLIVTPSLAATARLGRRAVDARPRRRAPGGGRRGGVYAVLAMRWTPPQGKTATWVMPPRAWTPQPVRRRNSVTFSARRTFIRDW